LLAHLKPMHKHHACMVSMTIETIYINSRCNKNILK
jgi:hypothetical protein